MGTTGVLLALALTVEGLRTQGTLRFLEVADMLSDVAGLVLALALERTMGSIQTRAQVPLNGELRMG